jgi:hypothetical protein
MRTCDRSRAAFAPAVSRGSGASLVLERDGLRVAPSPRVFVELRRAGVRGEEAAMQTSEILNDCA